MRITTCYTVPIQQQMLPGRGEGSFAWRPVDGALMKSTSDLCLEALRCCADIFLKEWGYLSSLPVSQKAGRLSRKRAADLLVHSTRDNEARYPGFDGRFPYMPAYTRRAVVADALGMVSSYMSNRARWEALPPGRVSTSLIPLRLSPARIPVIAFVIYSVVSSAKYIMPERTVSIPALYQLE